MDDADKATFVEGEWRIYWNCYTGTKCATFTIRRDGTAYEYVQHLPETNDAIRVALKYRDGAYHGMAQHSTIPLTHLVVRVASFDRLHLTFGDGRPTQYAWRQYPSFAYTSSFNLDVFLPTRSASSVNTGTVIRPRSASSQPTGTGIRPRSASLRTTDTVVQSGSAPSRTTDTVVQPRSASLRTTDTVVQPRSASLRTTDTVVQSGSASSKTTDTVVQPRSASSKTTPILALHTARRDDVSVEETREERSVCVDKASPEPSYLLWSPISPTDGITGIIVGLKNRENRLEFTVDPAYPDRNGVLFVIYWHNGRPQGGGDTFQLGDFVQIVRYVKKYFGGDMHIVTRERPRIITDHLAEIRGWAAHVSM